MAKQLVQYIGRGKDTEKLYKLEEKAVEAVKKAAEELLLIKHKYGMKSYKLYENAIPETLAQLCDAFSSKLEVHIKD